MFTGSSEHSAGGGRGRLWRMRTEAGDESGGDSTGPGTWGRDQSVGCGDTEWLDSDNNLNIFYCGKIHIA